jgi:molybdopterin synthase catalytic subunit
MQPLGVVGDGADELVTRLTDHLDGQVATIECRADALDEPATGDAAYAVADDGTWTARGRDNSVTALLDDLAPEYDYVLAAGYSGARIPTVLLGDASTDDVRGEVVLSAGDVEDVDLAELAASLSDLEPHVTLESLIERAKAAPTADRAGAIATFTGRVRARDAPDDSRTEFLEFEKYEGVAEQRMAAIEAELAEREGVFEVLMHHRVGVIEDGEDIVFVVVLAGHREEAFRTVEDGINRLKDEVPIFKKETTTDEEFWVHEQS